MTSYKNRDSYKEVPVNKKIYNLISRGKRTGLNKVKGFSRKLEPLGYGQFNISKQEATSMFNLKQTKQKL